MSHLTALIAFVFLTVSSAWAQTPAPTTPAPGATPGSPPAGDAAAAGGGIADYWWIILVIIVIAAVIYFMRRGRKSL
jgi:heme/copper-type cytochrome/quinol oxidase subunit 2